MCGRCVTSLPLSLSPVHLSCDLTLTLAPCTLQSLVSRPPPRNGGNLHRQLFSGFYLTTVNDIHSFMDEAITAGTPATLLRVQHTLQFLVQIKLIVDEWQQAMANVRLNTTRGKRCTGGPDHTCPVPSCTVASRWSHLVSSDMLDMQLLR